MGIRHRTASQNETSWIDAEFRISFEIFSKLVQINVAGVVTSLFQCVDDNLDGDRTTHATSRPGDARSLGLLRAAGSCALCSCGLLHGAAGRSGLRGRSSFGSSSGSGF